MFQYSMTQWILGNEDMRDSFIRLKKYGYDGIEFAAEPYQLKADDMLRLMSEYGLSCTSLCGIFSPERDLSASDETISGNAVHYLCDSIDWAVKVGARCIIVVPSPVGRTRPTEGITYREAWDNAVKNVRTAAEYAQENGVILVIEAINRYETYLVNTLTKAVSFVEDINHPAVGIMADLFHMSLEENNIEQSLRMIAPYLQHVHIADNTREAAGMGSTDFKQVLYVLRDIGYQNSLTMEFMPRVADPYEIGDRDTHGRQMDMYAEQAINYMKMMEKSIECL